MESDQIVRAKAFVVPRIKKDLSSKEFNLYLSKKRWVDAGSKIKEVNNWKNTESHAYKYTARASFEIIDDNYKRGECIDIDRYENPSKKLCGEKISKCCVNMAHKKHSKIITACINITCLSWGILILYGLLPKYYSLIGLLWLILPINISCASNNNLLWRIWRKSMMPYIQLYVSLLEGYCFCDLCNWDIRITAMAPPLFFHNLMIINSDAVYFKKKDKSIITVHLFIFLLWKIIIMFSLRFGYFKNIYQEDIFTIMVNKNESIRNNTFTSQNDIVTINNGQLFFSKATSMVVLLIGQIIFRLRHSEQAYALRTNYTIKSNKEWNEINRKNRVSKRLTLDSDVKKTKEFLKI